MARGNLAFTVVLLATVGGSIALMTPNAGIAGKPSAGSVPAQSLSRTDANPQPGTSEYSRTQTLEEFLYGQDMTLPPGRTAKEPISEFIQDQRHPRVKCSVDSRIATPPDRIQSGLRG